MKAILILSSPNFEVLECIVTAFYDSWFWGISNVNFICFWGFSVFVLGLTQAFFIPEETGIYVVSDSIWGFFVLTQEFCSKCGNSLLFSVKETYSPQPSPTDTVNTLKLIFWRASTICSLMETSLVENDRNLNRYSQLLTFSSLMRITLTWESKSQL